MILMKIIAKCGCGKTFDIGDVDFRCPACADKVAREDDLQGIVNEFLLDLHEANATP